MDSGFYSFSEQFKSGIDFYTGDEQAVEVFVQITSSLTASAIKIASASSTIAIDSSLTASTSKIAYAASNILIDGAVVTVAKERHDALVSMSGEVTVDAKLTKISLVASTIQITSNCTVSAQKIILAVSPINATSNLTATSIKISRALTVINATSNLVSTALAIKNIASILSGSANLAVAADPFLITAKITIFSNTSINAQLIRFSNSIISDSTLIRTLLMLDGVPLTNQNRQFDVSVVPIYIENLNWQSDASRYYKNTASLSGGKRTFNLQWRFIPNYENKTVDLRASRNFINKKAKDGDVHTLTILKQDESGTTPYTEEVVDVLITNYSENLIRRDLIDNVYYFDCSMSLEEV